MLAKEVEYFARTNLDYYGLGSWIFKFFNSKINTGMCDYNKKIIYYSKHYLDRDDDEIKQTILHEIAHALTPGDCHGRKWALACYYLNIPAQRFSNVARVPGKFSAKCSCGIVWQRYNELRRYRALMCPKCSDLLIFERNANVS